jgi:hypothetical protein
MAQTHPSATFQSATAKRSFGSRRDMSYDSALVGIRVDSSLPRFFETAHTLDRVPSHCVLMGNRLQQ